MKKSLVTLLTLASVSSSVFASTISNEDMMKQIELLKAQIAALESKLNKTQTVTKENKVSLEKMMKTESSTVYDTRFKKLEKKVAKNYSKINDVKTHDANDNIKWDVDFRTQLDNIQYKMTDGTKVKNNALLTNRLWLNMAYQADENSIFKGTLSYNKAYGDTANHSQSNTNPGYANFDWVTNENALDNTVKVKEAYWLYTSDSLFGNKNIPWTVSVGRRPSTDGLGINLRVDQKRKSPLAHTVNVEFDGASLKFDLDKLTGVPGMWWKFCAGRGLTNAKVRFTSDGTDYASDDTKNPNVDMFGFIFVPYDDGQYSVHTNYARAWNLIGFSGSAIAANQTAYGNYAASPTGDNYVAYLNSIPAFQDVGDIDLATIMFKTDGVGNNISDYLDNTIAFASFAMSKTHPNSLGMLGSTESETGHSIWLGVNAPCPISPDDAKIGIEWNKGSKYWRSMTYGEDNMVGSKISTRGTAWEIYRNAKITDALSWNISYVKIDYDYAGSNAFFGAEGNPDSTSTHVKKAENFTTYVRYRF